MIEYIEIICFDGSKVIQKTQNGIITIIPEDPQNADFIAYLEWKKKNA